MDDKHRLTRIEAEHIIRSGGSVSITTRKQRDDGTYENMARIYSTLESLPGEAEFARDDPDAQTEARERLLKQKAAVDAELKALGANPASDAVPDEKPAKRRGRPRKTDAAEQATAEPALT